MKISQWKTLLTLQHRMNSEVHPEWIAQKYPYLRAVIVEGGEAIEHHGWKWWKHQAREEAQLRLELVDILHFYLSKIILDTAQTISVGQDLIQQAACAIDASLSAEACEGAEARLEFDGKAYRFADLDLLDRLELMIGLAVSRRVSMRLLLDSWATMGGTHDELFNAYVGKNILNIFRQRNGYKTGEYRKHWFDGREDNEHLSDLLLVAKPDSLSFEDDLLIALQSRYDAKS